MKKSILLLLLLMSYQTYSQKNKLIVSEGKTDGSYLPFDIKEKKVFWNNTYYIETVQGEKEFEGKTYTEFKQVYINDKIYLSYIREENGVFYQYEPACQKEFIKVDTKVGKDWVKGCDPDNYKVIAVDAELKTPYFHYKNLLVIEVIFNNIPFAYYYQKGIGFVAATKGGKLYCCVAPDSKNDFELNPFIKQNPNNNEVVAIERPFSRQNPKNTFAVKGIGYLNFFEGGYGGNVGLEKGFLRNHSVGIKYFYDLALPHREGTVEDDSQTIDFSHNKSISFALEYKYYFDFGFMAKEDWCPYISLAYRTGKRTFENDPDYPHDFYRKEMKINFIGPALGIIGVMTDSKAWTIDMQTGYFYGKTNAVTDGVKSSYKEQRLRFELMVAYNFNW